MIKLLNAALTVAVLVVALQVYGLEHKSRDAGKRLSVLREEIAEERETIRRLRAEWSYLNTPARLEKLASHHLSHGQEEVKRVLTPDQITDQVPSLQKTDAEKAEDTINNIPAGDVFETGDPAPELKGQPDPIGQILKEMDQ